MKGKRVASLLFFVALLFELSSCGIQEEEIVKEDKFYNQKNNIEISLGMTRQEVDRLLTETVASLILVKQVDLYIMEKLQMII